MTRLEGIETFGSHYVTPYLVASEGMTRLEGIETQLFVGTLSGYNGSEGMTRLEGIETYGENRFRNS